jgi:hypothetical protein
MREGSLSALARALFLFLAQALDHKISVSECQLNISPIINFLKTRSEVGLWVNVGQKWPPARFRG